MQKKTINIYFLITLLLTITIETSIFAMDTLPPEIITQIYSFLSLPESSRLGVTNHRLYNIYSDIINEDTNLELLKQFYNEKMPQEVIYQLKTRLYAQGVTEKIFSIKSLLTILESSYSIKNMLQNSTTDTTLSINHMGFTAETMIKDTEETITILENAIGLKNLTDTQVPRRFKNAIGENTFFLDISQ